MKGFKTIGTILSITIAVLTIPEVKELISLYPTASTIVYGSVMVILRGLTTTALFSKE